ncbi:MAG: hypothetical protein IKM97_02755 [Clostridia bacterium]|nr:hypothetical protein [Clostridia bacterium]
MKKYLKIIVPLICVLVVFITFFMLFDIKNKVEESYYGTNSIELNEGKDEEITKNNNDENTSVENEIVESTTNTVNQNLTKEEVLEDEDNYSKSKLDEAKKLVQKEWGEDNTVYFTNEGFNSEGLYMVAVRDKTSTAVKNYFKVNLETKKVMIDY